MFVELHARSAFSFLEGAAQPEEMATVCAERGMSGMALADANGVYGSARFHLTAKKYGVRAYIGSEIDLRIADDPKSLLPSRLPLLVASRSGYQNLCRLVTQMKLRGPKHNKKLVRSTSRVRTAETMAAETIPIVNECATSLYELENY